MSWIDYQKAYDIVPHSWILECARMVGVAQNMITLIENSIANWKTVSVDIKQGVTWDSRHQKKNLSRRLIMFVTIMTPLIPRDTRAGYQLKKE